MTRYKDQIMWSCNLSTTNPPTQACGNPKGRRRDEVELEYSFVKRNTEVSRKKGKRRDDRFFGESEFQRISFIDGTNSQIFFVHLLSL